MDTDSQPDITPSTAPKNFPVGIVVPVGTIGYKVESFSYRDSLTDGTKPDNGKKFLWLNLRSVNTGPREADYAAFKLLDGTKEYDLSSKTGKVSESLNAVKKLAQGEVKSGVLIFELPPATNPKLKIIAAPPVKDEMFISLTAPAATPSKTAVKPSASPAK